MTRTYRRAHARRLAVALTTVALTVACSPTVDGRPTAAGGVDGSTAASPDATNPDSHDRWLPSETNPDPTVDIDGVYVGAPSLYAQRYHFAAPDRVAYDRYPPVGGPHDPAWAACDGVVYSAPVRDEMMVHALEHGAVWIAYDPDGLPADERANLEALVPQVSYLVMTPYPGLATPLSLQAWGHQLPLDSSADPRFEQFLLAMLRNPYSTPELNATCANPSIDVDDPPPFVSGPPGADGIPLDYAPPAPTTGSGGPGAPEPGDATATPTTG
ncbi:DUF3105 domain-containing protein [Nakamurella deserti]|uniref:DUF3105 domain-containing protein n=1 Tax=Nakamurella deserti TaxID=2164074 RepID=UPI0013006D3A|nr:DUF3105 domain-containing protein [Nakamurella deserti]